MEDISPCIMDWSSAASRNLILFHFAELYRHQQDDCTELLQDCMWQEQEASSLRTWYCSNSAERYTTNHFSRGQPGGNITSMLYYIYTVSQKQDCSEIVWWQGPVGGNKGRNWDLPLDVERLITAVFQSSKYFVSFLGRTSFLLVVIYPTESSGAYCQVYIAIRTKAYYQVVH